MTDYRPLLADRVEDWMDVSDAAARTTASVVLDTRVPWLCPDCKGDVGYVTDALEPCFHPNAPTIGDLLHWGENVATATQRKGATAMHATVHLPGRPHGFTQASRLLAALRNVEVE